jgi:hypothetical protein
MLAKLYPAVEETPIHKALADLAALVAVVTGWAHRVVN